MARTIAERISQAAERSFVGRRAEVEMLRDAILADEPAFVVAYVHGPGGIGKSRLVQATVGAVSPPVRALLLDCGQIEPTPRSTPTRPLGSWMPGCARRSCRSSRRR